MNKEIKLLSVRDLSLFYVTGMGRIDVFTMLSFDMDFGQILCVMGESGCGKSSLVRAILGILPENAVVSGDILFCSKKMKTIKDFRLMRKRFVGCIFQEPAVYFHPMMTVLQNIFDGIMEEKKDYKKLVAILEKMGLSEKVLNAFPFELSGGMAQRVAIAEILLKEPKLIIADEMTSSLDVETEKEVIDLLLEAKSRINAGLIFITHKKYVAEYIGGKMLCL